MAVKLLHARFSGDAKARARFVIATAPEQIGGGRVGPAADIFAWGRIIVYAANGTTPFGQDSIPAVMHRILHEQPDLGGISGPLRDIAGVRTIWDVLTPHLTEPRHHRPSTSPSFRASSSRSPRPSSPRPWSPAGLR